MALSLHAVRYADDADEIHRWIAGKRALFSTAGVGADLASTRNLAKQHNAIMVEVQEYVAWCAV